MFSANTSPPSKVGGGSVPSVSPVLRNASPAAIIASLTSCWVDAFVRSPNGAMPVHSAENQAVDCSSRLVASPPTVVVATGRLASNEDSAVAELVVDDAVDELVVDELAVDVVPDELDPELQPASTTIDARTAPTAHPLRIVTTIFPLLPTSYAQSHPRWPRDHPTSVTPRGSTDARGPATRVGFVSENN